VYGDSSAVPSGSTIRPRSTTSAIAACTKNRACIGVSDGRAAVSSRTHESIVDCWTLCSSFWSAGVRLTRSV